MSLAIVIASCKSIEEKQKDDITNLINQYFSQNNIPKTPYTIILPNQGCMGCITVAENFLIENAQDSRCTFILTSIMSLKVLKTKLGGDIINSTRVHLDKENFFGNNINQLIYPVIIWEEKGETFLYFQKPGENAFEVLRKKLK